MHWSRFHIIQLTIIKDINIDNHGNHYKKKPLVVIAIPIEVFNKYNDWNYENEINFDPFLGYMWGQSTM